MIRYLFWLYILPSTANLYAGPQSRHSAALSSVMVDKNRAIVTLLPGTQLMFSSESLRLDCSAIDDRGHLLNTRWSIVNDDKKHAIADQSPNGSLVLIGNRNLFTDVYRCIILIRRPYIGILLSSAVNIRQSYIRESLQSFQEISVQSQQIVRLNCSIMGYPEPLYQWYHNGTLIHTAIHDGYFAGDSSVLYVVLVSDSMVGNYSCFANNNAGTKKSSFILKHEPGTKREASTNSFLFITQNLSVAVNQSAVLECMPKIQSMIDRIMWKGPGVPANRSRNGPVFTLDRVERYHQGAYQCYIEDDKGQLGFSATIYLTVKYLPVIIEPPREHIKSRGEVARFTCNAEAVPPPSIRWFKNGELIVSEGRMKVKSYYHQGTFPNNNLPVERVSGIFVTHPEYIYKRDLVVSSIRPEDGGLYQCIVSNELGEVSGAALLVYSDDGERRGPFNLEAEVLQSKRKILLKWEIGSVDYHDRITVFILHFHRQGDVENTEPISPNDACEGVNCTFECCDLSLPLKAFTNYTFWISALLNTGTFSSPSNEIHITSWERVADSVTDLKLRFIDYHAGAVEVSWFPPAPLLLQGTVQEYRLQYCIVDNCEDPIVKLFLPGFRSHVLQDLNRNSEYKIRVIPKTKAGYPANNDGSLAKFPWINVKIGTLDENVTDFCGTNNTESDVNFTLSDITKNDALLIWSSVEECPFEVSIMEAVNDESARKVDIELDAMRLKIQNLEPDTLYRVSIDLNTCKRPIAILLFRTMRDQSVGVNYMQRDSSLLAATANDALPYPLDLRCTVKRKSLLLQWSSNTDRPISHFTVRYSPIVDNIRGQLEGSLLKTVKTNDTFMYISDVKFDQLYIFAVRSESDYGSSKFSDDLVCLLPKSVPPKPLQLRYSRLNETGIVIFWNLPDEHETTSSSTIVSFRILYENVDPLTNRRSGSWSEILVDGSSRHAHLPSLSPKTDYRVTVTASNRAGVSGPPSEPLFIAMRQSLTSISKKEIDSSGDKSHIIVVERKSYFEGIVLGICVAIVLILIVLCIKIGRNENFNFRTPVALLGHGTRSDRCIKRNQSSSTALEVRSCPLKLMSNELKHISDFHPEKVGASRIEHIENHLYEKVSSHYVVPESEQNVPFIDASIVVSESIQVDIPQSVRYSTCLVHSAVSTQSESVDYEYHDPDNAIFISQKPNTKSSIQDDCSTFNHPSFFSMPNLLTDSGIGFDEYCCLSSNEYSSKENHTHHPAFEFSIIDDESIGRKCKGSAGSNDKHSVSYSSKLEF